MILLKSGMNNEAVRYLFIDGFKIVAVVGFSTVIVWDTLRKKYRFCQDKLSDFNPRMFGSSRRIYLTAWKEIVRLYVVERDPPKERLGH
eukprot:UN28088